MTAELLPQGAALQSSGDPLGHHPPLPPSCGMWNHLQHELWPALSFDWLPFFLGQLRGPQPKGADDGRQSLEPGTPCHLVHLKALNEVLKKA